MRNPDPALAALVFAALLAIGTAAYVVDSVLSDGRPHTPVPYSTDPSQAEETWETIQAGLETVQE